LYLIIWGGKILLPQRAELAIEGSSVASAEQISAAQYMAPGMGWQNPFATETAGLFKTGSSAASAEQISAAQVIRKS
jgi:hypothetical protein